MYAFARAPPYFLALKGAPGSAGFCYSLSPFLPGALVPVHNPVILTFLYPLLLTHLKLIPPKEDECNFVKLSFKNIDILTKIVSTRDRLRN